MNNDSSQNFGLVLIQGSYLIRTITYYDYNGNVIPLTGYTADMIFRNTIDDTGTPIIEASTSNGQIAINASAGTITFTITSTQTSLLSNGQTMVYNLFITSPGGIVTALLGGSAICQGSTIR